MRAKIELVTLGDVKSFVAIATKIKEPVYLVGNDFKVSAKSLLGVTYSMEWDEIWCECEKDIYSKIKNYVVE
jgi:hypothetical protein